MDQNEKRIQIVLAAGAYLKLEWLKDVTEAESKVAVIRDALRIYEWLVQKALAAEGAELTANDIRGFVNVAEPPVDQPANRSQVNA